jgi:glycosyltransferase involved in cell wall biosynthesis
MGAAQTVELVGYLDSAVGVGEAARLYGAALEEVGVSVSEHDIALPGRDTVRSPVSQPRRAGHADARIVCVNPEQLPMLGMTPAGPRVPEIGVWSWEVDPAPSGWRPAAGRFAELWTYSDFSARLIEDVVGVPVFAIPPPVLRPHGGTAAGDRHDLPRGFRVLVMFDYLSTLERKNPLGAVEAFRRSFAPEDGAVLVVKSINARHRPDRARELASAIGDRPDIVVLEETLSGPERDALVQSCDCYLSLHRSEGHGLPLAEAMAAGKPVVATAFGGNTEFMTGENSYLVDWRPALVGEGVEHYPPDSSWAEPDIGQAADLLRRVFEDDDEARRRSERARADVAACLSPRAIGERMCSRLAQHAMARGIAGRVSARLKAALRT